MYAIWEPEGVFLYLEQKGAQVGEEPAYTALLHDRRGRWEETYNVTLTEPEAFF